MQNGENNVKERKSYIGTLNGVNGIWCDKKPKGLKVKEEITFYTPEEGKTFLKDGEYFSSVVIKEGVDIADYEEVDEPVEEHLDHEPEERPERAE